MAAARFRCAVEVGFLKTPQTIFLAKDGFKAVFGGRVEQDDEFDLPEDAPLGSWMDPVNDEAEERAAAAVEAKKRKKVAAANAAPTEPLQVPRSGMAGTMITHGIRDVVTDARVPQQSERAAPRRRAKSN